MRRHALTVIAAFAIGATLASGVAVAVTAEPATVKACESTTGVLGLRTHHGQCAHGYSAVALNRQGKPGKQGLQGIQGLQGVPGTFSASDLEVVLTHPDPQAGQTVTQPVSCQGHIAVTGGAYWTSTPGSEQQINSGPVFATDPLRVTGWTATLVNGTGSPESATVWAYCATS